MLISLSMDMYALIYTLWVMKLTVKNKQVVSNIWPYFVTFVYLVIIFKYLLHLGTSFNPNYGNIIVYTSSNQNNIST